MNLGYRTVFNLIAQPESIQPPYAFYAIFLFVGVFLSALAFASARFRWRQSKSMGMFAGVWLLFVCYMSITDFRDVAAVRRAVEQGEFSEVDGCLVYFRPGLSSGSKSAIGNEEWNIDGTVFDYGTGEARPGYHLVEPNGGVVHPDSRVRVFFVVSPAYGRKEIVRIDTAGHSCPPARVVKSSTEP